MLWFLLFLLFCLLLLRIKDFAFTLSFGESTYAFKKKDQAVKPLNGSWQQGFERNTYHFKSCDEILRLFVQEISQQTEHKASHLHLLFPYSLLIGSTAPCYSTTFLFLPRDQLCSATALLICVSRSPADSSEAEPAKWQLPQWAWSQVAPALKCKAKESSKVQVGVQRLHQFLFNRTDFCGATAGIQLTFMGPLLITLLPKSLPWCARAQMCSSHSETF